METPHQNGIGEKPQQNNDESKTQSTTTTTTTTAIQTTHMNPQKIPTFGKALFLICGMVNFGFSFGFPTSLSVYFLDWQDSFQKSRAYTASIHATSVGALNTAAIIPGLLMSRFGDRVTLLLGCCLASLGMILSSFATSIPYMVVTAGILFGMGCCMINLPTIPCITSVFTKNQSIYIASLCFGSGVVNTVLPFFYTFLSTQFGWRGSHLITGGLILQTCIASLVITSYRSPGTKQESDESLLEKDEDCNNTNLLTEDVRLTLPKTGFLLQGVSMTSLHSSTFGSQILGARPRKNTSDSLKHSKENHINLINPKGSNSSISHSADLSEKKNLLFRLKASHPFLFDVVFLLEVVMSSFCVSSIYATVALMMDFTRTKGYTDDSVSVFLIFLAFLFSMFGKIFSGSMNLIPVVHSYHLLCSYGVVSSLSLISLIYTSDYLTLCVEFAVIGFVLGGLASVYPKCVLDTSTVDIRTYPLALGINNSFVGLFDVTLPVVMGYTVDTYQTYTPVLYLYSAMALLLTIAMTLTFYIKNKREFLCHRNEIK